MSFTNTINCFTDWFLIVAGAVLILKAFFSIDVAFARYVVIGFGALLLGFGVMYRRRRLKLTG